MNIAQTFLDGLRGAGPITQEAARNSADHQRLAEAMIEDRTGFSADQDAALAADRTVSPEARKDARRRNQQRALIATMLGELNPEIVALVYGDLATGNGQFAYDTMWSHYQRLIDDMLAGVRFDAAALRAQRAEAAVV